MSEDRGFIDRTMPRQQKEWDIRGALNFIFGGAGAGLLFACALAVPFGADMRALEALGLLLVAAGLFCVWLKIGRPWRAFHVVRRPSTSWMSREAWLAPLVFLSGGLAIFSASPLAIIAAGATGLVYAYAQGRILKANLGIPAWRRWSCVALIVATALAEGVGLLCLAAPVWPSLAPMGYALACLVAMRFWAWRAYRNDLRATGAPSGSIKAFDAFEPRFVWIGHATAGVLALAGAYAAQPLLLAIAGLLAAFGGALFKYVLVCRAAFTQGFSLPRTPSRGRSSPGPGLKPGWEKAGSVP